MKLGVIVLATALTGALSCTPTQRQDARSAIEVTKAICIVAKQTLSDSDVAAVCGVAEPLFGPMQDLLASARASSSEVAMTQARAMTARRGCPTADAGAPAP